MHGFVVCLTGIFIKKIAACGGGLETIMKRRFLALLMVGCLLFSACGSEKETKDVQAGAESEQAETENDHNHQHGETSEEIPTVDVSIEEVGIDAFVTLGEYKGLELEKTVQTVTEEDIDSRIATALSENPIELTDSDAAVEMGDTINLDYSGSIDGVVFDGGTAEGQTLVIGSGSFIDDFEEQMVGMKAGESGTVEVTFPEDYKSEDKRGKDAVFAVTVNSISRPASEVTEEWLLNYTNYKTMDEYREGVRAELQKEYETNAEYEMAVAAWEKVYPTATFLQYPKDLVDKYFEEQKASYEYYAAVYEMEYDEFLEYAEISEEDMQITAVSSVQMTLVLNYICDREGITEDSEVYQNKLNELVASNGFSSIDEAIAYGISEANIDYAVKYDLTMETLLKYANITEVPAETAAE